MSAKQSDRTTEVFGGSVSPSGGSLLEPGTILNGRYRIERELGRGGIGVVYLARDQRLHNLPVVVKLLLERLGDDEDRAWFEKKFKDEIRALAQIDHPGVVRALDVGELADGRSYLVMQHVSGVDLRSLIQPSGMDLGRVANLIRQIGHALSAAHQNGVLHRDLKPENIMLQTVNSEGFVKLIDFGMATVLDSPGNLKTTIVAGTICYMAPEQMEGRPSVSSDIFGMGVIAYEMVTGCLPFVPRTPYELVKIQRAGVRIKPRDVRPALSELAQAVILRALEFDPRRRFASAAQFGDKLADALSSAVISSAPDEPGIDLESYQSGVQLAHVLLAEVDGYSRMTVEEQTRSLEELQAVVRRTVEFQQANAANQLISQAATRGMALVFFGADPVVAVRCAVEIADALRGSDQLRVRIGMHTGPVKVIPDINGRPNVSGDGVDTADRVMSSGQAGQILMSRSVADVLRHLNDWSSNLRDLGDRQIGGQERVRVFRLTNVEGGTSDSNARAGKLRRFSRIAVAAFVCLLIAVSLIVILPRQSSLAPAPVKEERKLSYVLIALKDPKRYPGSKPAPAPDGMIFETGDLVKLNVTGAQDGQLYIINEGPVQKNGLPQIKMLFPRMTSNGGSAEVKANQPIQIPSVAENPDEAWFEFDKFDGKERLWLIWSANIIAEFEAVKIRANPEERGVISDPFEVAAIAEYLASHSKNSAEIQVNEATVETTISTTTDVAVGVVKLEHRRTKR
jgi:serine/threonine protein kinase